MLAIVIAGAAWAGCSSKAAAPASTCVPVANGCAGVPDGDVCSGTTCTDGVACTTVVNVGDDASLTAAAASATAGTCIVPAPGSYAGVVLPGGVSLLGKGASSVSIGSVELKAGSGAVVRGLSVGAKGIVLDDDVLGARIDSVRVSGTTGNAISVGARDTVSIVSVDLANVGWADGTTSPKSTGYGVFASGAASVSIEKTHIANVAGPGLWLQSPVDGCTATTQTTLGATGIIIEGAQLVGAGLQGVKATLNDVAIRSTDALWKSGEQGGGLSIAQCSDVTAGALHVSDSRSFGVLVDHSSAKLGDPGTPQGIIIEGNQVYGVWVQHVGQGAQGMQAVSLSGAQLRGNGAVGIGLDGGSQGIIIEGATVDATQLKKVPASNGTAEGQSDIGDGLAWTKGSSAVVKSLTLTGNQRTGVLVAGMWGQGSSASVQIGDGNAHGIIIEGITGATTMPGMESIDASQMTETADMTWPVALGPLAPAPMK